MCLIDVTRGMSRKKSPLPDLQSHLSHVQTRGNHEISLFGFIVPFEKFMGLQPSISNMYKYTRGHVAHVHSPNNALNNLMQIMQ